MDVAAAQRIVDIAGHFQLTTGEYAGQPMIVRDWQAFILLNLFGFRLPDGTRRFRDAYISVGRGNGKSPFAAYLAIVMTFLDGEGRAEGYCWATKYAQARIVFDEAQRLVERSDLKDVLDVRVGAIIDDDNFSSLKPLGSDSKNTDGLVPHFCVLDELHEWRDMHRGLWDKVVTALGKRRMPMCLKITTAGTDQSEIWREQLDYSTKILEQVVSDADDWVGDEHFAYVAAADMEAPLADDTTFLAANPMLREPNSPVKIKHLREMVIKAQDNILAERQCRRYHLNQLVTSETRAIMPETWALGSRDLIELDEETEAYAGIDLARSNDWAAVSLVIPIGEDPKEYDVRTWAWTCERPSEGLSESLDLMELRARASNLTVCPGSQIDLVAVRDFCGELAGKVWVRSWAYDDAYARETAQHLTERTGLPLIKFLQSHKSYNEPTKRFLDELAAGRIRHGDDPLLKWQALNMHLHTNAKGHSMPDKLGKYKIDSMVALIMAFSEALCSTPADSYYTDNTVEAF